MKDIRTWIDTGSKARWIRIYTRFKRNRLAMAGLYFSILYLFVSIVGPMITPYEPGAINYTSRLAPPSPAHPFGTDSFGRDVLTRVLYGARLSLRVAVLVVGLASIMGVVSGLVAGYVGWWVDEAISRFVDVLFAFPSIILGLVIVAIIGPGLNQVIIALAISFAPVMTRVTRGSALAERKKEYVIAAKSYGENHYHIMFGEILPNIASAVMVQATIIFAFSILAEAGLSYLGLSAQPPAPTWGVMISMGQQNILNAPWISLFPGLAIMSTVLGLTFLGVGLRDALDPKTDIETNSGGAI